MYSRSHIKEGMTVLSSDGDKLGKVFAIGEDSFQIEKGLFFPKDYIVRYSEILDVRGGDIVLTHGKESLRKLGAEERYGTMASTPYAGTTTAAGLGATTPVETAGIGTERRVDARSEDITVPLHKEELDVIKRESQVGEVRVHKDVVEEEKVMEVPVRRERVRVERRDVKDRPAMHASFQEETIAVPLRAEEVEVSKRAVVDEEVVIHKDATEEQRRVAETVRREKVDIRSDGDIDGPRKLNLGEEDPSKTRY